MTGEIVKTYSKEVNTVSGVSGGIQATAAVGKSGSNVSNLVFIPFARTPDVNNGVLIALDKNNFEKQWEFTMENYTWSSPVLVYDNSSTPKGYVLIADSKGFIYLLDGATGSVLVTLEVDKDSNFEASPVVFNNIVVIGSRGQSAFGIRID
jgi:outer membrane protein assembly factor BamB